MTSHRSGETEDDYIADLAVGLCTGEIKTARRAAASARPSTTSSSASTSSSLNPVYAGAGFRTPKPGRPERRPD